MTEDTYKKTLKALEILSGIWTVIEFIYKFITSGAIAFLNIGFLVFAMTVSCHALYIFNIKYKDTVKEHLKDTASIQKLTITVITLIIVTILYIIICFNSSSMSSGIEIILIFEILPCVYMSLALILPIAIPQYAKKLAEAQFIFSLIPCAFMTIGTVYVSVKQYGWFLGLILGIPFSGLMMIITGFIPYYFGLFILSIVESEK